MAPVSGRGSGYVGQLWPSIPPLLLNGKGFFAARPQGVAPQPLPRLVMSVRYEKKFISDCGLIPFVEIRRMELGAGQLESEQAVWKYRVQPIVPTSSILTSSNSHEADDIGRAPSDD